MQDFLNFEEATEIRSDSAEGAAIPFPNIDSFNFELNYLNHHHPV